MVEKTICMYDFVTVIRKSFYIQLLFFCTMTVFFNSKSYGIERAGYLGQSWSFPIFLTPATSKNDVTYHFDTAYFLYENWSACFSIDTQVGGSKYFLLELGPNFYPLKDVKMLPFATARLLYSMVPKGDPGWLSEIGFETHLGKSPEVENFRLRLSSGGGEILYANGNGFFIEMIRVGLLWSF